MLISFQKTPSNLTHKINHHSQSCASSNRPQSTGKHLNLKEHSWNKKMHFYYPFIIKSEIHNFWYQQLTNELYVGCSKIILKPAILFPNDTKFENLLGFLEVSRISANACTLRAITSLGKYVLGTYYWLGIVLAIGEL